MTQSSMSDVIVQISTVEKPSICIATVIDLTPNVLRDASNDSLMPKSRLRTHLGFSIRYYVSNTTLELVGLGPFVVRITVPSSATYAVRLTPEHLRCVAIDVFPGQEVDLRRVALGDVFYVEFFEAAAVSPASGVVDMYTLLPRLNADALTSARLIRIPVARCRNWSPPQQWCYSLDDLDRIMSERTHIIQMCSVDEPYTASIRSLSGRLDSPIMP